MNRYQLKRTAITAIGAAVLALATQGAAAQDQASEVVGYYPGWKSSTYPVTAANVDAARLTMALYAFLDVCWDGKHGNPDPSVNDEAPCQDAAGDAKSANGALVFRDAASDGANLQKLVALKREHPGFKVVVSVGGWDWSNRFSDLAASPQARAGFVASSVKLVRRFGLDGVDIDWEFPGEVGVPCWPGRVCARPADKNNFVLLARELRAAFDAAGKHDGKHYVITIASGAGAGYVRDDEPTAEGERGGAWLRALAPSLDWINVMTYDFHLVSEPRSGHLAALRADPDDPDVAQGRTVPGLEICSVAGGMNMVPLKLSLDESIPAKNAMQMGDCPCCGMHAAVLALPPVSLAPASGALITGLLPVLFYQSATPLFAWTPLQPRGPPAAF